MPFRVHVRVRGCAGPGPATEEREEGGDEWEGEALSLEDSKGWGLPWQWMTAEPMNHSSTLCAGSCFLCVVHLVRDSCPRQGHKCEDLDPPARKHSSEQLSAPWRGGLKAVLIPRGRRGSYCCLCVHVHTPTPTPKQTTSKLHVCDMKSWYSFLELLFLSEHRARFPFGKSSLSGGCFFHPCVDIQTQCHSWSGLDPRQVLS